MKLMARERYGYGCTVRADGEISRYATSWESFLARSPSPRRPLHPRCITCRQFRRTSVLLSFRAMTVGSRGDDREETGPDSVTVCVHAHYARIASGMYRRHWQGSGGERTRGELKDPAGSFKFYFTRIPHVGVCTDIRARARSILDLKHIPRAEGKKLNSLMK